MLSLLSCADFGDKTPASSLVSHYRSIGPAVKPVTYEGIKQIVLVAHMAHM